MPEYRQPMRDSRTTPDIAADSVLTFDVPLFGAEGRLEHVSLRGLAGDSGAYIGHVDAALLYVNPQTIIRIGSMEFGAGQNDATWRDVEYYGHALLRFTIRNRDRTEILNAQITFTGRYNEELTR